MKSSSRKKLERIFKKQEEIYALCSKIEKDEDIVDLFDNHHHWTFTMFFNNCYIQDTKDAEEIINEMKEKRDVG